LVTGQGENPRLAHDARHHTRVYTGLTPTKRRATAAAATTPPTKTLSLLALPLLSDPKVVVAVGLAVTVGVTVGVIVGVTASDMAFDVDPALDMAIVGELSTQATS
jgi:hypothetical protein